MASLGRWLNDRPERGEECEQWGCLGRSSSQCKGPEVRGLVRLRSSQGGPCGWSRVSQGRVGGMNLER